MGRYMDYIGKASVGRVECHRDNNKGRDPVTIGNGECIKETPDAILVELKRDHQDAHGFATSKIWFPKSVLHDDSEVFEDGGNGKVIVFQWWAEREGFG